MIIIPHSPKQETVLFSEKRTVIAATGIQWGKTMSGALWLKMMMHRYTSPDDNFIITSPTYPIFKQSTLPPFLSLMTGTGKYDKKEECFVMNRGGRCWFRTGKNPDSVVGITNVRGILCDEAGLYSLYFWENIQGRSSFYKAPVRIVTSPYSLNWLYRDYIKPKRRDPDSLPNVELIQATSRDNPYFPADEYEEKRRTMDPRRFNMMYGGEFDKMQGLVYDCFDEDLNGADLFPFPSGTQFFGGIDWGYTEPFVLVVHAVLPSGLRFQVSESYHSGLTLPEIGEVCREKMKTWGVVRFYAGPDQPGSIEYLNRIGCPCVPANNDIRLGIDTFYELIKARDYKILKGTSPHTLDEMDTYHYPNPKDLKPDQSIKEAKPVGQNDHACLIGETLVTTQFGEKRIDQLNAGEYVLTPFGFRKVTAAFKSGDLPVYQLTTQNGTISGTGDHPFYVTFRGFIPLDAIRYCDNVPLWKNSFFLKNKNIIGMASIIVRLVGVLRGESVSILQYGKLTLGQFQRGITYTIKMVIHATMKFPILKSWKGLSTFDFTESSHQNDLNKSESILIQSGRSLKGGIDQKKGENGTESMAKIRIVTELKSRKSVNSVNLNSKHLLLKPHIARTLASLLLDVKMAMTILKKNVLFAINFLVKINITPRERARENVLVKLPQIRSVYNITVEDAGCFFANGFLVSNCDANRYCIIMTHRSHIKSFPKVGGVRNNNRTEEQRIKSLMKKQQA